MKRSYQHLTQEERYQIYAYLKAGFSKQSIARRMDRHISTIKRELKRNTGLRGYRPQQAQRLSLHRQQSKAKAIKMTPSLKAEISNKLREDWSPEQIQGRFKAEKKRVVCPATIYAFIQQDKVSGGTLYTHRRHKHYKRRAIKDLRGHIKNRISIDERPAIVDKKERLGDWEADTMIGKGHKGVLVTLTERYSKLNLITQLPNKQAEGVTQAIINMLKPYKDHLHTLTFDNGKEFAYHEQIKETLKVETYFAHPYSSWERGLNENHNGLIRQYLPKTMPLDTVTDKQAIEIQNKLNHRPRKRLNFKTPLEVYYEMANTA